MSRSSLASEAGVSLVKATDTPVVIAGGGPVGMILALVLAHHGVRSVLLERNTGTTHYPKMDLTNGRSMELFRRLGLVGSLRAAGVAANHPFDIMWATSPSGFLLHRFRYPSANELTQSTNEANDGSGTLEPGLRISQILLEPVLKAAIDASPLIDARFGWAFESLRQDDAEVHITIRSSANGESAELRACYLIGCDGGGSRVRKQLELALEGQQNIARIHMVHFTSEAHQLLNPWGVAWHLQSSLGSLVAQDDASTWTLQAPLPPGADEGALDPSATLRRFVGQDFPFKILVSNPWSPHLVIADRYRVGRVFLAGDSAHQVIPTGGYGMNTGVGDAFDLGWKLAAVINGWGGIDLLDSYEQERMAIAVQNRAASVRHFGVRVEIAQRYAEADADARGSMESPDAASTQRRNALAAQIATIGNAENESWGIEHGYRYSDSRIICEEPGSPPAFDPLVCISTTWPGSRLPHIRLGDGTKLLETLGPHFTLLCRSGAEGQDFAKAAAVFGIPLKIVTLSYGTNSDLLERNLLLVRPDDHIAWRGDRVPSDIIEVLRRVTGNKTMSV